MNIRDKTDILGTSILSHLFHGFGLCRLSSSSGPSQSKEAGDCTYAVGLGLCDDWVEILDVGKVLAFSESAIAGANM